MTIPSPRRRTGQTPAAPFASRGVNPKGRWFFRMQEATKQPNFTPDVPASVSEAHGSNAGDVLEAGAGWQHCASKKHMHIIRCIGLYVAHVIFDS